MKFLIAVLYGQQMHGRAASVLLPNSNLLFGGSASELRWLLIGYFVVNSVAEVPLSDHELSNLEILEITSIDPWMTYPTCLTSSFKHYKPSKNESLKNTAIGFSWATNTGTAS